MDADGVLEPTRCRVAPLFSDPRSGESSRCADSTPLKVAPALPGDRVRRLLPPCPGRPRPDRSVGSVAMAGSAVLRAPDLGDEPWTACLTEDLDLGFLSRRAAGGSGSVTTPGWRSRGFEAPAWSVSEPGGPRATTSAGVTFPGCSSLVGSRSGTRVDSGIVPRVRDLRDVRDGESGRLDCGRGRPGCRRGSIPPVSPGRAARNLVVLLISILPICYLMLRHQQHTKLPLRPWELPA